MGSSWCIIVPTGNASLFSGCDDCDRSTSLCSREADSVLWCRCRSGFRRDQNGRCAGAQVTCSFLSINHRSVFPKLYVDEDECESAEKVAKCDHNAWCI